MDNNTLNKNGLKANGDLKLISVIVMGGALFSMHFGVGSMVWPVTWGKDAGSELLTVYGGVWVTGVFLTFLAYVALARNGNDFTGSIRKTLGNGCGNSVLFALITLNCPLYGIPMMTAATWLAIEQATGWHAQTMAPIIVYNVVFYAIAYLFLIKPGKAMERMGKWLFPVLITLVLLIIIVGMINPISTEQQDPSFYENAFAHGFTEGYATTEILCALLFGVVIFESLKEKGVPCERYKINTIKAAAVAMGILTFTHFGNMFLGSHAGKAFENLEYTSLYLAVADQLIGKIGSGIFLIAIVFAALTTAVGLGASAGEFYPEVTNNRINNKKATLLTMIISCAISAMGLSNMLEVALPILDMLYPATIIYVLHFSLVRNLESEKTRAMARWAMIMSLVFGAMDALNSYCEMSAGNAFCDVYMSFYKILPLSEQGLVWVIPCAIAYLIPLIIYKNKPAKAI